MKTTLLIVNVVLLVVYAALMIETLIKVKKSEGKRIEEVKSSLNMRINISIVLIIMIFIINIVRIFIRN